MVLRRRTWIPIPLIMVLLAFNGVRGEDSKQSQGNDRGLELFEKQIEPVLAKHCYRCHSQEGEDIGGGLELDSPIGLRRGGDSGPILVAHEAKSSPLIAMLRHREDVSGMPPKQPLPDSVVEAFVEWIRLGAPDSRKAKGPTQKEARLAAGMKHWSFQSPQETSPPKVRQADWPRGAIDQYVLAKMEEAKVEPVGDASRRTLVRRVYFDLVGLPPTPQQVEEFVNDKSQKALAKLIDRLLDSPRFGERWARHWLDVVRYAESSGMEFNFTYPHAWPYRDYVIDSLNDDKPYDQFLREQIAGDLMPSGENDAQAAIEARRIAVSMLSFGPKRHNSGGMEFRMDVVDDQINVVTRATLALTVACARCHDHKFDPIPTKDYYSLAGIFLSTEPLYGTIKQKYSNSPTDLLPLGPDGAAKHQAVAAHAKRSAETEADLTKQREALKKSQADVKVALRDQAEATKALAASQSLKTEEANAAISDEPLRTALKTADAALAAARKKGAGLAAEVKRLEKSLAALKKQAPSKPIYAMSARDRAKPADTWVAIRGNYRTKGELAPRGFLSAVDVANAEEINPAGSGRLELANWIASAKNPLTARVMVNRIWHHLLGRGISPTVDNFGLIGKPPTNPQLLDFLAIQFVRDGWSIKKTIRQIMLSRTYQLSSAVSKSNESIDPDNRLLWRSTPRRLDAEAIRDSILAVSGKLDLSRPQGSTVTPLGDRLVRGVSTDKLQPASTHRSVYLPVIRDYVPEIFDLFDFPSPSLVVGSRAVTNVPSQALYMRNSKFVTEQSQHAARRLLALKETADDASRVNLAMSWALAREPTKSEREAALRLVHSIEQGKEGAKPDPQRRVRAWAAWFHTLFTTAEFRYLVDAE